MSDTRALLTIHTPIDFRVLVDVLSAVAARNPKARIVNGDDGTVSIVVPYTSAELKATKSPSVPPTLV